MNTVFAFRGEWFEKGFQGVLFLHSNSKGGDVSSAAVSCFARHVSRAVTSSCRGNICQRALCPFVCICTHLTKTLAQSLYPAPTSPFSNESLPWRRPLCSEGGGVSWQQITCCFRRADTQARCCCGGVCHRSLSLSLSASGGLSSSWVFATSPLQWWIVTELLYLRLPEDSLLLQSPPLHSSSLWPSWVN